MSNGRFDGSFVQLLSIAAVLASCAAQLPHPEEADAVWASAHWPGATVSSLKQGRSLFVTRCSGCHHLPAPESKTPEQWRGAVDRMADDARLSADQAALIARFLATVSARASRDHAPASRP